jgi:hypothetical protein
MERILSGILGISILSVLLSFKSVNDKNPFPKVENNSFETGEYLEFNINFGWFTVGEAYAKVNPEVVEFKERNCYKYEIYGETSGFFKMINKVNDFWMTYLDTSSLLPIYAYRDINEGRHKKKDKVNYFHPEGKVTYERLNKETGEFGEPQEFETRPPLFDLLGGIMYLRSYDYSEIQVGDTIEVNAFYNRKFYDFKVIFEGRESIRTKLGKINALRIKPEMPNNNIFSGKNSITMWLSDDENKLPLKFEVDMFIGDAGIEITGVKGIKNNINFKR